MSWLTKFFKFREKSDGEVVKPFLDHMEELRWTIIKMVVVQVLAMIIAFYFRKDLVHILQLPLAKVDPSLPGKLIITGIADSFIISLELSFFTGIALAFPFLVYFIAEFVLPALTRKERKFLAPGILTAFLLFLTGVSVAYKVILPATIAFFWKDAQEMQFTTMWTWNAYFSFSAWLCFGFGLMCEVPVIVIVLALLGFVSFSLLNRTRPYAYTLILVLSAVIAPTPDPMTFITLSIPIVAMYESCIWVVYLLDRRKRLQSNDF
ncbi:MAG: Sec-independent protein translocase protein TatC [Chthoniobacteraceae bacterium]|nr:Sec-independent protein translocase protein TatC [Chthoniobacteraceae bacterium]